METFTPPYKLYPNIKLAQPVIVGFDYRITELKLFESLSLTVYLYDMRGQTIEIRHLKMEGDEYKAWSNDDTYVISWIKSQLNAVSI